MPGPVPKDITDDREFTLYRDLSRLFENHLTGNRKKLNSPPPTTAERARLRRGFRKIWRRVGKDVIFKPARG